MEPFSEIRSFDIQPFRSLSPRMFRRILSETNSPFRLNFAHDTDRCDNLALNDRDHT
jgi:hypothetical protein